MFKHWSSGHKEHARSEESKPQSTPNDRGIDHDAAATARRTDAAKKLNLRRSRKENFEVKGLQKYYYSQYYY